MLIKVVKSLLGRLDSGDEAQTQEDESAKRVIQAANQKENGKETKETEKGDSNTHVEILASSSKTPPVIEKVRPDNVQILENPHQSKRQDSSESVVGPDSRELLLSSKEITSNSCGLTPNRASSIQDNAEVILNDMSGMGADISPLQDLLGSFFGMATSYDQERSALVDKTTTIKESEPYLKVKGHLELVSKERDEKSEEVSEWACQFVSNII
ncbi:hypothetical protein FXO38_21366 [Capsicum annuum]|nr:hypothetical protein FXO38_21366 [Capsicum annuum]